jgi:hypothetical protein
MNVQRRALASATVAVTYAAIGVYVGRESRLLLLVTATFLASFVLLTPNDELGTSSGDVGVFDAILRPRVINAAVVIGLVTMLVSLIA